VDFGNELVKKLCYISPDKTLKLAKSNVRLAGKVNYEYGEAVAISRIGWAYDLA
jgi:hypothetical protein